MKHHAAHRWIWPGLLVCAFAGCQSSEEAAVEAELPAVTPAAASAATLDRTKPTTAKGKPGDAASKATAQFTPPFPDRLDMFEPPKRAQGSVRRDDQDGESVVLMGFVNVDRPRAILSIDGVIAPIHEGGEKYGVQVRVIQPPTVVLERGRRRWTATLE